MCFGSDAPDPPAPDPRIGQAATMNAQLGKDWLDFSKQQFKVGETRNQKYDQTIDRVVKSSLDSQDKANAWAQEDRDLQAGYREKYDQWAAEDRQLGRDAKGQYDQFAKDALDKSTAYQGWMNDVANDFGERAGTQFAFAEKQQGRYNDTFVPIEDRLAKDAMEWDSDARLASEAGKARADVLSGADAAAQSQQRQMASMGVNPNSGRFAAASRSTGLNTALAAAGAQNVTRDNVRAQGIQLRGQAAQVGQQVLGNANTATGLGMQARSAQAGATQNAYTIGSSGISQAMNAKAGGLAATGIGNTAAAMGSAQQGGGYAGISAGLSAGGAATSAGAQGNAAFQGNNAIMAQGFSGGMQGYANQGNMLNNLYGNQLNGWAAQQQASGQASSGIGSMIGTLGGAAISAY